MVTPRRPHAKTRTGCKVCKRRKVKCDEHRPSCGNCIKHAVQCDYQVTSSPSQHSANAQSPIRSIPPSSYFTNPHVPSTSHYATRDDPGQSEVRRLQMVELQLLHQYTTSTCFTFQKSETLRTLWAKNIPEIALSHEYVMRGILAVAALHLAHCQPDRRNYWASQAILQHQPASSVALSIMSNLKTEDITPLYIFSILTAFFSLGSPRRPGNFFIIGENAEWLFLMRGITMLTEISQGSLKNTPLAPLMLEGQRRWEARPTDTGERRLEGLETHIRRIASMQDYPIYQQAIDELKKSFPLVYSQSSADLEITDVFIWPNVVKDEYLVLLRHQTPESLAILAYFCVLLKRLDHLWWVQGWSAHLISQIYNALDEEGRLVIQWPMQEIGWAPGARHSDSAT